MGSCGQNALTNSSDLSWTDGRAGREEQKAGGGQGWAVWANEGGGYGQGVL